MIHSIDSNPRRTAALPAAILLAALVAQAPTSHAGDTTQASVPGNPLFVMNTFFMDKAPEEQTAIVAELGYEGFGGAGMKIPETLAALDGKGLRYDAAYFSVNIDSGEQNYDPALPSLMAQLAGKDTLVWLLVNSKKHPVSSPEGDEEALEVLGEIAGMAAQSGLRVALYPHVDSWLETMADAIRLTEKLNRPNVGVTFNLCHWLKAEQGKNLRGVIEAAMPYLYVVSINGADEGGENWDTLIQPLGEGSYDVGPVLRLLAEHGYEGPIGLQGYGIKGDARAHLDTCMRAWREMSEGLGDLTVPSLVGNGLSAFREPIGAWAVAGTAGVKPGDAKKLAWTPGTGIAVNGPEGRTNHLVTKAEHGDVEAHIEFMVPKGSNSGVYFQGRYEIQVLDSWGVAEPKYGDCGGIYQGDQGYPGRPPSINAARRPGQWQSYDVVFRAPRFDAAGQKTDDALFVEVRHNGVLVHENQAVSGPTRAAMYKDEKPLGPIMFQGDHGPVAYRNIRIYPRGGTQAALARIEREAALEALDSPEVSARIAAAHALAKAGTAADATLLAERAATTKGKERAALRQALRDLPGDGTSESMITNLALAAPAAGAELMTALGARQVPEAVPAILARMQSGEEGLLDAGFLALNGLARAEHLTALVSLLEGTKGLPARRAAEKTIGAAARHATTPEPEVQAILDAINNTADRVFLGALLRALALAGGNQAYETLCVALNGPDVDLSIAAIRCLSLWENPKPAETLIAYAQQASSPPQRILAARGAVTLLALPSPRAPGETAARLREALDTAQDTEAQKGALTTLAKLADPGALDLARACLDIPDTQEKAAQACVQIAQALGPEHAEKVAEAMHAVAGTTKDKALAEQARTIMNKAKS